MKWLVLLVLSTSLASAQPGDDIRNRARVFEDQSDWDNARAEYVKLEKIAKGEALYHEAFDAFQANDNAATTELANKCAQIEGPFKARALVLFADAVFRSGEVARAKQMYRILIDKKTGDQRAMLEKKIIACNRALKLPERDGL